MKPVETGRGIKARSSKPEASAVALTKPCEEPRSLMPSQATSGPNREPDAVLFGSKQVKREWDDNDAPLIADGVRPADRPLISGKRGARVFGEGGRCPRGLWQWSSGREPLK